LWVGVAFRVSAGVSNNASDRIHLSFMAKSAKSILEVDLLETEKNS
jgi:hypothetical protein